MVVRGTAILFLLERSRRSRWRRVDADEPWLWHAGGPIDLSIAASGDGPFLHHRLGGDIGAGVLPRRCVPKDRWQAAHAPHGWTLASRVVVPGFDFAGFTLAPPGGAPEEM